MTVAGRLARLLIAAADGAGLPLHATIRSGAGRGIRLNLRYATREYVRGTNELPVQRCLTRLLKPGDVFLDLGSSIGFFALIASRLVGPAGRVYAVEPVPANARCIRENARRNRLTNIRVLEVAAGGKAGQEELILARHPGGAPLSQTDVPPDPAGRIRVTVVTVDDLIATGTMLPPDIVKIDVEGAELDVLRGMARTLAGIRPKILFEVDGPTAAAAMAKYAAVGAMLEIAGYTIERLDSSYPDLPRTVIHGLGRPFRSPGLITGPGISGYRAMVR